MHFRETVEKLLLFIWDFSSFKFAKENQITFSKNYSTKCKMYFQIKMLQYDIVTFSTNKNQIQITISFTLVKIEIQRKKKYEKLFRINKLNSLALLNSKIHISLKLEWNILKFHRYFIVHSIVLKKWNVVEDEEE